MIRITQQDSAKAAKSYYATADYYSEGQEIVGSWGGKGASRLGLEGTVDKFSFERLCDNLDPKDRKAADGANAIRADGRVRFHLQRAEVGFAALRHERRPGHHGCVPRQPSMRRCAKSKRR